LGATVSVVLTARPDWKSGVTIVRDGELNFGGIAGEAGGAMVV
jgi:hypothetical protein